MVIPDTMQLPAVCYLCNIPTDRRVRVVNRYDLDKEPTLLNFLSSMILVFQSRVYYSEYGDMDGTSPTVAITLSQCKACSKKGKPKPVYVDFENMAMTFIVHKGFKQRAMETATEKE